MRYSSSVGLGLSVVFGCLLLALIAEIYYLLWWKKRVPARELLYLFCCKKHSSLRSTGLVKDTQVHEPQASSPSPSPSSSTSSSWVRSVTQDYDDMSVETELLRLHSLCGPGPPRFLFTIKEETKEDLESEDRSKNGSRGRSLSDVFSVETPFFTPLASPAYVTPPLTPRGSSYRPFSPLSYSSSDAEFNRIRASPPPQFKFLKGVEDKREKRKPIERFGVDGPVRKSDENGSFITLIVSN
ncbi:hypothetical protein HanHA300_Chr07g0256041 [Helianthus annuus]|uniref:uncharacterized protein LOC110868820 n=1 Tax=Helianthus annuus TaxID=4232 RepID=UPI000B906ABE|nr:uncharacterized protein LOC110868820 [Helianthus annuus]KAJ0551341.1 hypothetical protein HanHA300_Chr07g0256041 [Helianthus annuus]KAJ0729634.1 hypothetical protein HanLR1_Chr07g0255121 [Helianthus annuus]KAJ0732373.1 hypothetical protein HanOQP8_Chr07g0262461 [Helianthus annuus]